MLSIIHPSARTEGWHLPALDHNPNANLVAIVDTSPHPQSTLNPNLEPLTALREKYHTAIYPSTTAMLQAIGPQLDGVLIATPHATHYAVCREVLTELDRRQRQNNQPPNAKPLHILLEKPMTTDIQNAILLYKLVQKHHENDNDNNKSNRGSRFWINHSANYRAQTKLARDLIASGRLGRIRHVTAFFASPLKWIFDDPACTGWNLPTGDGSMLGNGFGWGQSSHLWAFLYHVMPQLQPQDVYCSLTHSATTGADVSFGAVVRCTSTDDETTTSGDDGATRDEWTTVLSVSGTSLLPGNAHSDPPVPKKAVIEIFGDQASLHYAGNDRDSTSGRLELRTADGSVEVVHDEFHFENLDHAGSGPESLQHFVQLCCGNYDSVYEGATVADGLRSIQTIDAMYRSHASSSLEKIIEPE